MQIWRNDHERQIVLDLEAMTKTDEFWGRALAGAVLRIWRELIAQNDVQHRALRAWYAAQYEGGHYSQAEQIRDSVLRLYESPPGESRLLGKEMTMTIEQEHKRLTNIAARLAACLWDFHSTCPECGNDRAEHMPNCTQTYEREFHGPQDTEAVFVKAFGIMTPN